MRRIALALAGVGCVEAAPDRIPVEPPPLAATPAPQVVVTDEGLSSGYQDLWFGHYNRGRGASAADFDGDGDLDVFSANPAGESFLIRNVTPPGGPLRFEPWQVLFVDALIFSGTAADHDNDGDPDLYVAGGGNDGYVDDVLFRNDLDDGGDPDAPLVQVGPLVPVGPDGHPFATGTMGAIWFDADNDGLLDAFASFNVKWSYEVHLLDPEEGEGYNQLWHQGPDGRFTDRALEVGLDRQRSTRNSDVLDFDGDGDLDLFENNWVGRSVLWRNLLVETGALAFEDVTAEASLGGTDLSRPFDTASMCAIATDLDNDGWEDLVVFRRGPKEPGEPAEHAEGHLLWMNVGGAGFVEVAAHSNLNDTYAFWRSHTGNGVMGCQIGDVDLDGFPDLFVGNGGPDQGERNQLFVSSHRVEVELDDVGVVRVPWFEDWSPHIDFAPPDDPRHAPVGHGVYPFRTHGSMFADLDGDGVDELAVHNGGPGYWGTDEQFQEPNRLFRFTLEPMPHWLRVRVVGDGVAVNRDGIGARVRLRVGRSADGATWDLYETRKTASGFGAQNAPYLLFGLGDADAVHELEVRWPDGAVTVHSVDAFDRIVTVSRDGGVIAL